MNRIIYMVLRNFYRVPFWFYQLCRLCRADDPHTEDERYNFLHNMVKKINRTGRVEVNCFGAEKLPSQNGFILFPNHQGLFDSLALIESCPCPFGIVIKKEALKWILVKQVVALLRGIGIDREDIRASLDVIKQVTEEVRQGRNYIIFPEGTRSPEENEVLPFKAGTFKSAVNAKCPIIPVALIDCHRPFDLPSIRKEKVQVHFLDPIYPEQYEGMKTKEIAETVHDKIQDAIRDNKDRYRNCS